MIVGTRLAWMAVAALALGAALVPGNLRAQAGTCTGDDGADRPCPVVVELFTSQGCNTCPPADALLEVIDRRPDVIGLALHIDYWDYLGWKDSFALPQNARRQRAYAKAMSQTFVYTPQAVVDGQDQVTGSDRKALEAAIEAAKKMTTLGLSTAWDGPDTVVLDLPSADRDTVMPALARGASIWLYGVDDLHEVTVERGENAGRKLRYTNVVHSLDRLGEWDGEAGELRVDLGRLRAAGRDKAVVAIQAPRMGRMIGAAEIRLNDAPGR